VSPTGLLVAAAVVLVAGMLGAVAASIRAARNSLLNDARGSQDAPHEAPAPPLWPTPAFQAEATLPHTAPPPHRAAADPEATLPPGPPPSAPRLDLEATLPHAPPPPAAPRPAAPPSDDDEVTEPISVASTPALQAEATVPAGPPPMPRSPAPPAVPTPGPTPQGAASFSGLPRLGPGEAPPEPAKPVLRDEKTANWDGPPVSPLDISQALAPQRLMRQPDPAPLPLRSPAALQPPTTPAPPPVAPPPLPSAPSMAPAARPQPQPAEPLAGPPRPPAARFVLRRANWQRRLLRQLPDCLDLVGTCLEGGVGVERALARTCEELRQAAPELSRELALLLADWTAGHDRQEALAKVKRRCSLAPLDEFLGTVDEASRLGTSIGPGLARLAESLRREEAARVEAWARRLPTLVMVAVMVFMVPPVFVLLLGSSIVTAARALGGI
jgi:hypothetical protein